jgi:signal peptidase
MKPTLMRRILFAAWLALSGLLLLAVAASHLVPLTGYHLVVIRGASMEPTIHLGALAVEGRIASGEIVPGDVVTLTLPSGTLVTHRVLRVVEEGGTSQLETRGDANPAPDPALVPATEATGIVRFSIPLAGYVVAWLNLPSGMLSVLALLGSIFIGLYLMEDLEQEARTGTVPRAAAHPGLARGTSR